MGESLLPRLRSRNHQWFLRLASTGGPLAVIGGGGAVTLATVSQSDRTGLWTAAIVAVIVIGSLGVVLVVGFGAVAWLTRPISPEHAATLKATALTVASSLQLGMACNYGGGYKPREAFRAHYGRLATEFQRWDGLVDLHTTTETTLREAVDVSIAKHELTNEYDVSKVKEYMLALMMRDATCDEPARPTLKWFKRQTIGVHGPLEGSVQLSGGGHWIVLTPAKDESVAEWEARVQPYIDKAVAFVADTHAAALPLARAVLGAAKQIDDFKRDDRPKLLNDLARIQVLEPPCIVRGCESC